MHACYTAMYKTYLENQNTFDFYLIVPPPIEIKIINDIIQLREPIIHPRGIILHYEIVAMLNPSEPILSNISTSTLDVPTSMLLTEPGTYSIKVSD